MGGWIIARQLLQYSNRINCVTQNNHYTIVSNVKLTGNKDQSLRNKQQTSLPITPPRTIVLIISAY